MGKHGDRHWTVGAYILVGLAMILIWTLLIALIG